MEPTLKVVFDQAGIDEIIEHLKDKYIVAYDCETTGLKLTDSIVGFSICASEEIAYYVVLARWDKDSQTLIPVMDSPLRLLQILATKSLVMHNAIFDCSMAEAHFKIRFIDSLHTDTMIMAHLLDENRPIGLKPLSKQYFGENADQEAREMKASVVANGGIWEEGKKGNKEMYKADIEILGKYGAKDAWLTYKLLHILLPELVEEGLDDFFYKDESMPLLKGPTYELNTTGLRVDQIKLIELKNTLKAEIAEHQAFILSEIEKHIKHKYPGTNKKNTFNVGSDQQIAWVMFGQMGLEFGNLTDAGKDVCELMGMKVPYYAAAKREFISRIQELTGTAMTPNAIVNGKKKKGKKYKEPWAYTSADKKVLAKYAPKYKWIAALLEFKRKKKLLTTYVEGIEKRIQYGIIRPSFLQAGTTSGRYSSRDPNFQNLPRDDKSIKRIIVPRQGRVFVGADYSQLEPRVFSFFSNDTRLGEAFRNPDLDWYSTIGIEVYSKTDCTASKQDLPTSFKIKYKDLRHRIKTFSLAATYGASAWELSQKSGKSEQETQEDMDNYFKMFPGVQNLQRESHAQIKKQGYVTNLFGRKRRVPEAKKIDKMFGKTPHRELPYIYRKMLNLAVNHRIQATGASIVNRGAIKMHQVLKEHGIDCKLVLQVHDSLVYECLPEDAELITLIMQDALENTTKIGNIPLEAIPKTGNSLADV